RVNLHRPGLAVAEDEIDPEEADETVGGREEIAEETDPRLLKMRDRPRSQASPIGEAGPPPADPLARDSAEPRARPMADEEGSQARAGDSLLVVGGDACGPRAGDERPDAPPPRRGD